MTTEKKKVLLIDDDETFRTILSDALTEVGLEILHAEDGESGFNLAVTENPALILLDIRMPKMDGIEFLKSLRTQKNGSNIPVYILSEVSDVEHIADGMSLGVRQYIVKSDMDLKDIVAKIKEEISKD